MNIVTRAEQLNKDYPKIYKRYPRLISYFNNQISVKSVEFSVNTLYTFIQKHTALTIKNMYLSAVNSVISIFYTILNHYLGCGIRTTHVNTKYQVCYISFFDSRIGSISIDSSSRDLGNAKINSKHRFDIDLIINSKTKCEMLHHIYSYISDILEYVYNNNYSNEIIFFDDTLSKYCKVNFDSYLGTNQYDEIYNNLKETLPIKHRSQLRVLRAIHKDISIDIITHNYKGKL